MITRLNCFECILQSIVCHAQSILCTEHDIPHTRHNLHHFTLLYSWCPPLYLIHHCPLYSSTLLSTPHGTHIVLCSPIFYISTDLENLEESRNLKQTSESQGIYLKDRENLSPNSKSQESCCTKPIFSQFL